MASDRHGRSDGYGLGLAIVNAVAQAHHATLTTSARPEGGLSIAVRFAHPSHPTSNIRRATTQTERRRRDADRCGRPDASADIAPVGL
ncbi:hypothetical protein AB0F43_06325 [Kribbella sp. NPDC023972]|uniref:hypothetical protein n=1 Tax=Kribbella sp. NPDC023972 TaxID=3154795 RepID=UPI0033C82B43